jgi:hypothetical protein
VVAVPVEIVKTEDPPPGDGIDVGLKLAVAPVGSPVAESAMAELSPPETEVVAVDVPLLPAERARADGDAAIVKLGELTVVVTLKAKSSKTNDVLRFLSSTPTREI